MKLRQLLTTLTICLICIFQIQAQYCPAAGAQGTTSDYISKVRIYDLVKTSGQTFYSDFTNLNVDLAQNATYPLSVHMNNVFDLDTVYTWIDFDQNEIFEDNELVLYGGFADGNLIHTQDVTIPDDAVLGATRMRVRAIYVNTEIPNYSCDTIFGEVEDYTVTITEDDCANVGEACDDGIDCTTNDMIDANCNCRGEFEDDDLDGICNDLDECPGVDDNLDLDNNGIPDLQERICEAEGSAGTGADWINRVRLYDINNPSFKTSYSDFTDISTDIVQGVSYDLALHAEAVFSLDLAYAWIDFNQNNKFEESETIVMSLFDAELISQGVVDVPEDAVLGETTMRVRMIFGENIENPSCGSQFGEVEDYTVNIVERNCANVGEACDDGLDCTTDDKIDENCNCRGTQIDTDYDGVCDEDDICPGEDDLADANNNGLLDCLDYCAAGGTDGTGDDYIEKVSILDADLNELFSFSSGKTIYSDFTDSVFTLDPGVEYAMQIELLTVFEGDVPQAWVDYDTSRSFEGASEFINMLPYEDSISIGLFTVPDTLKPGEQFRIRVRNLFSADGLIDPCGFLPGEVEDYTLEISESSSINVPSVNSLKIFPNPAENVFFVEFDSPQEGGLVTIHNSVGQSIFSEKIGESSMKIQVHQWEKGIYFLSEYDEEGELKSVNKVFIQ